MRRNFFSVNMRTKRDFQEKKGPVWVLFDFGVIYLWLTSLQVCAKSSSPAKSGISKLAWKPELKCPQRQKLLPKKQKKKKKEKKQTLERSERGASVFFRDGEQVCDRRTPAI